MKNGLLFCLVCLLALPTTLCSQVYYLNNGFTNGGSVRSCNGRFKDTNPFGNYKTNEKYTVTFNTDSAKGQAMQLEFDTLDLGINDTLFIYDGPTVTSKLITTLTNKDGVPISIRATALNTSGSLTVRFASDSAGIGSGWNANIICKSPCQSIGVQINSVPAADANGFINICKGESITFTGQGIYNQNNIYYNQSDSTAKFLWILSNGKDTTGIFANKIQRTFSVEEGTIVQLALMDKNECYNSVPVQLKVRTSLTPSFNIKPPPLCINDTSLIIAKPVYPKAIFSNIPVYSDNKPLNDGIGKCYETSINVNQFAPQQKLTNLNELEGILINMEHSFLGDFTIAITAPNGVKVYLKKQVNSIAVWGTFLGEPVDEAGSGPSQLASVPGRGYDYLFSPNPKYGTMANEKGKYQYTYIDKAGQKQSNHFYLPQGSYASEDTLAALLGTPLNGLWTIEVCDNFKEDNGFIFYWTIKFKPSVYPDSESYTGSISSQRWLPSPGLINFKDSAVYISQPQTGLYNYTYRATDQFGCNADTTISVTVNPFPIKPNLGNDATICLGKTVTLTIGELQPQVTYTWSMGAINNSSQTINRAGNYTVTATNAFGCSLKDTVAVIDNEPIAISLGSDTILCASNPLTLAPAVSGNINSYAWNTGETTSSIIAKRAGTFVVSGSTSTGCQVSDTIVLQQNAADLFTLPPDTTICAGTIYRLSISPPGGSSFTWEDGSTTLQRIVPAGLYAITLNYNGCIKNDAITVSTQPLPIFSLGSDTIICTGFEVPLRINYSGASYRWNDGSTGNSLIARNTGTYWAEANILNCIYRDSINITTQRCECNVKMPNAFSPNGDGVNDVFKPEISCAPLDYNLSIYNRYGQLVFSTKSYNQFWAGTQNDKLLAVGTYYYLLTFYNVATQKPEQFKGSITLLK